MDVLHANRANLLGSTAHVRRIQRVEEAYVQTALSFLRESGLFSMRVAGLKNSQTHPLDFRNDSVLPLDRIGEIIRRILREELWCRLEGGEGFIHFGWDYYMCIGVSGASIEAAPPMPFFFELPTFPSSLPSKAFASLGALPERGGS